MTRMVLCLGLVACGGDVHVQTFGTATSSLELHVHDVQGSLLFTAETESDGSAVLSDVPRHAVVSVTAYHNDPVTYVWSESIVGVLPGDALVFDGVRPWDPNPAPAEDVGRVTLVASPLPVGAVFLWLGLFECGLGPFTDALSTEILLSQCSGHATPAAIAMDGAARPVAFQRLERLAVGSMAGQTLRLDGAWRTDWEVVRLDVEGEATGPVVASMQMGRWSHAERHESTPFSVPFLVPPGLELDGRVDVSAMDGPESVRFEWDAGVGDHLIAQLDDAVQASDGVLTLRDDEGLALSATVDEAAESLGLTAVSSTPELTHTWEVRLPAKNHEDVVFPTGFLDPAGFDGGFARLAVRDFTPRSYGVVREDGIGSRTRRERTIVVPLPE